MLKDEIKKVLAFMKENFESNPDATNSGFFLVIDPKYMYYSDGEEVYPLSEFEFSHTIVKYLDTGIYILEVRPVGIDTNAELPESERQVDSIYSCFVLYEAIIGIHNEY